jgi:hypothetical protein
VSEELRDSPAGLRGVDGIIVFVAGNDLSKPDTKRVLEFSPLRSCKIKEAFRDTNTAQIILILQLSDFVSCNIDGSKPRSGEAFKKFLVRAEVRNVRSDDWIKHADAIQSDFPGVLFFNIRSVFKDAEEVPPKYSYLSRSSYYEVQEEADYFVECSTYNNEQTNAVKRLVVSSKSDLVDWANPFESGVGSRSDTRKLQFSTRTLSSRSIPVHSVFYSSVSEQSSPSGDPNNVAINWVLKRKQWKATTIGLFTGIAAVGITLVQLAGGDKDGKLSRRCRLTLTILGIILIAVAAGFMFNLFNKV